MNSFLDKDTLFDQQVSAFLEQNQRKSMQTTLGTSAIGVTQNSFAESLNQRITAIEEQLNSCDSIYRLVARANSTREKERREQMQSLYKYAQSLEERLSKVEEKILIIPKLIKSEIKKEMNNYDNTQKITNEIESAKTNFESRIANLEKQFEERNKKNLKTLKKLTVEAKLAQSQQDDDRVDDALTQIAEMKRRQTMILDLLNAMRSNANQDYDDVNTQLSGLWNQLSIKH